MVEIPNLKPLPAGVELATDISVAKWVVHGLQPQRRRHIPVTYLVPVGFDAYVRIPHPGQTEPVEDGPPDFLLPSLIELLPEFTSTPDYCWLCVWSGYGFWYRGAYGVSVLGDPDGRVAAEVERVVQERNEIIDNAPQVVTRGREYFLFHGPISSAGSLDFEFDGSPQQPNLWWPDDRAWCVASDIDLPSTYVGGSRPCIDRLIATPVLNASEVAPDDDVSKRSGH